MIYHHNRHKFIHEGRRYVKFKDSKIHHVCPWKKKTLISFLDIISMWLIAIIIWISVAAATNSLTKMGDAIRFLFNPSKEIYKDPHTHLTIVITSVKSFQETTNAIHSLGWLFISFSLTWMVWSIMIPALLGSQTLFMKIFKVEIYDESGEKAHAGKIVIREIINNGLTFIFGIVAGVLLLHTERDISSIRHDSTVAFIIAFSIFLLGIVWSAVINLISFKEKHFNHTLAELATKTTIVNLKTDTSNINVKFK